MAKPQPDAGLQLIVAQVRALTEYHLERMRAVGHTPAEIAQDRAELVDGIVEALRARSPKR